MKKNQKRWFGTILICNLFLTLTVAYFSPMEVYLMNIGEFYFPFRNIWWFQLLIALGAGLVLSGLMFLLPRRAGQIAAAIPLGLGLGAYAQAMLMNGSMVSLTGAKMRLSQEQKTVNLVIWGVILLAALLMVILLGKKKEKLTSTIMKGVAGALTVMQTVAMVSLVATTDTSDRVMDFYLSVDGEFELSQGMNVVEFVLDTADGRFTREMLETFPELYDSLSGWTYYPNATSTHSRTYPSIPYMLTGEICHYDTPVEEYIEDAFEKSSFLKGLYDAGTDIRIFTWNPELIASNTQEYIANSAGYRYGKFENLNLPVLEENLMKIGLYKSLPYQFKDAFRYQLMQVNMRSFHRPELFTRDFEYMDPAFREDFMTYDPMTVTDKYGKAYRFYHLFGPHPGADWDENLNPVYGEDVDLMEEGFRVRVLRGSFKMIEDYIARMKELGVYDQATIIVTADHGISDDEGSIETLARNTPSCPILMVKYAESDLSQPMQEDESPVAHEDIFAAVEQAVGASVTGTGSGKSPREHTADETRDRYYLHTALRSDEEGEVVLREYLIDGNAEDFRNWHLTGNWWDILYSENAISDEEFDGGL